MTVTGIFGGTGRISYYRQVNRSRTLLLFLSVCLLASCYSGPKPPRVGVEAPDFTIKDSDRTLTLSQLRGKPVLLNFWATWCPPCIEEMPSMMQLQTRLGDRVQIVGVSMDVDEAAYNRFITTRKVNFLTVRDNEGKSAERFGTFKYPETYILDSKGVIRRKFIGPVDWSKQEVTDYLQSLE